MESCNRGIMVDSANTIFKGDEKLLDYDFTEEFKEQYPDAHEETS